MMGRSSRGEYLAIAKKPAPQTPAPTNADQAAAAFIRGAGKSPAAPTGLRGRPKKARILTQFEAAVRARMDAAAAQRGIRRRAWMQFGVSRALDQGEG